MNLNLQNRAFAFILAILFLQLTSCKTSRSVVYFNNIKDTTALNTITPPPMIIRVGDQLGIQVNSMDQEHTGVFNAVGNAASGSATGYLVNEEGMISFMELGKLKVTGLTKDEIKDMLEKKLSLYLKHPVVTVRLLNFKVNLIGEFSRPGTYTLDQDNANIIQVLALAGDISIYGKRKEVLLIRHTDSLEIIRHIDLTDSKIMNSPYFYLQQGDILYVKPNSAKILFSNVTWQLLPVVTTATSLVFILITFLKP